MRVLITGASSFIGRHLLKRLCSLPGYEVSGTCRTHPPSSRPPAVSHQAAPEPRADSQKVIAGVRWYPSELTNQEQLEELFQLALPDVVVHLAAVTDVAEAEKAPERASEVNVSGTENIVQLCLHYRARLVFLSTDYVFSGDRGYYREDETPSPVVHYGKTKWNAEQAVARELSRWAILRTSLVYGWPAPGGPRKPGCSRHRPSGKGRAFLRV